MNEIIRQKILKQIGSIQDEKELASYLHRVSEKLSKPAYSDQTVTLKQAMLSSISEKERRFQIKLDSPCFSKIKEFYWLTSGLHIVAAPSGHGKTFWAQQWAKNTAKQGHAVLFLSLEMTPEDLGARTLSEITSLPIQKIIENDLDAVQRRLMESLIEEERFQHLERIHIDKFGSLDWNKIYPRLMDRMMILKPKLVVVDYAQMIYDSEERDSRTSQVLSDIARELKLFADKTDSAVLFLSQMNRQALSDLKKKKWEEIGFVPLTHEYVKESGGIVEAADSVQIVCIPERFFECPEFFRGKFQLSIDKSRKIGKLKTILLPFDSDQMRFKED